MCARDPCLHATRAADTLSCTSDIDSRRAEAGCATSPAERIASTLLNLRQTQLATRAEQLHVLDTLLSESIGEYGGHQAAQFAEVQDTLRLVLVEVSNAQMDLAAVRCVDRVMAISQQISEMDDSAWKVLELGRHLLTTAIEDKEISAMEE